MAEMDRLAEFSPDFRRVLDDLAGRCIGSSSSNWLPRMKADDHAGDSLALAARIDVAETCNCSTRSR